MGVKTPTWRIRALVIALILSLTATILLFLSYESNRRQLLQDAFDSALIEAEAASIQLNEQFGFVMTLGIGLADRLSSGELAYTDIETAMRQMADENPDIDGIAVTFQPFAYDPDLELYQEYVFKTPTGDYDILQGATYNYAQPQNGDPDLPNTDWFLKPIELGARWNEPFYAAGAQKVLVEYGVPFYAVDDPDTIAGVVTVDYSLQDVRDIINSFGLGETGYGWLVSSSGTFLSHPQTDRVIFQSIQDLADELNHPDFNQVAESTMAGDAFNIELVDPLTDQDAWSFGVPLEQTGWYLGVVLNAIDFLPDEQQTKVSQMNIALLIGVTIILAFATVSRLDQLTNYSLWATSIGTTAVLTGLTILTWYFTSNFHVQLGTQITSDTALNSYLEPYRLLENNQRPLEIPTGIHVESLKFPDPISVTIGGYIWQKYPVDLPDSIAQGFRFAQIVGAEYSIEELYREVQGNEEVIVWTFGLDLAQDFDTIKYPFDRRDIGIHMQPIDLGANILFVPDLESYNFIAPATLPGVDERVVLNNWVIDSSKYSYESIEPKTNFGLESRNDTVNLPELSFTATATRIFLGAFIAYLMPGLVVALMLFAYLLSDRPIGDSEEIVNALNYGAALFFVIAFSQTALRDSIGAVGLTYMEYLYVALYVAIVSIALNHFLSAKQPDSFIIAYRNNILPKIIFFPILTFVLLIVSLQLFIYT